jgi:hypothetical protein
MAAAGGGCAEGVISREGCHTPSFDRDFITSAVSEVISLCKEAMLSEFAQAGDLAGAPHFGCEQLDFSRTAWYPKRFALRAWLVSFFSSLIEE